MNEEPAKSISNWLAEGEWMIYVATGVILLFYQFPAYKRFRTRALLLLVLSDALGVFVIVFDQTFGQHGPPDPKDWWGYFLLREIAWFTSVIVATVGALMFLRDYVRLASAASSDPSSISSSPTLSASTNDNDRNG